ncbi:smap [Symbiodinium microadriaticum]|nr:smap [Symbiodinium microadriaticum]CAE7255015.1 smap [Symbiodinium sp. KB8]
MRRDRSDKSGHSAAPWSRNQKQGIAFNYDSERPRRRARSRTPNRTAGEEKRKQQRENRKALFATRKCEEPKPKACSEESGESEDEPSKLVSAPGENAWERTSWEQSSFDSSADKAKFLRLMGAEKDQKSSSAQPSKVKPGPVTQELERQYWQSMQKQLYSRGRGLG